MRMFHHCGEPVAVRYNWDGLFTTYHTYPQGQPVPDFSAPAKVCPRCGCRFAPKNVSLRQWPVGTELLLYRTWDEGPGTRWVRVTVPANCACPHQWTSPSAIWASHRSKLARLNP